MQVLECNGTAGKLWLVLPGQHRVLTLCAVDIEAVALDEDCSAASECNALEGMAAKVFVKAAHETVGP
eukprot:5969889-Amphidinium_carterae.1